MTFHQSIVILSALLFASPTIVVGQSLADLARQEAARRQGVSSSGKVFTNADLKPVPAVSPAPSPVAPAASGGPLLPPPTLEQAVAPAPTVEVSGGGAPAQTSTGDRKDEKYWRQRVATARDTVARSQILEQALQARIASLAADFVNRDDPFQRAQIEADRLKALTELDRVKKEVTAQQAELSAIADEARRAGVPPGWVR